MEVTVNGRQYKIEYKRVRPWRVVVQIVEFANGEATGRSWNEPFDPERGSITEISGRIAKCISSGSPEEINDIRFMFQKDMEDAVIKSLEPGGDIRDQFMDEVRNIVDEALEAEREARTALLANVKTAVEETVKANYDRVFNMFIASIEYNRNTLDDIRKIIDDAMTHLANVELRFLKELDTIEEAIEARKFKNRFRKLVKRDG